MALETLQWVANEQVLYLTTIGRTTGFKREIEIWFVVCDEHFYLFAEAGEAAGWIKNIRRNPKVTIRIGERQIDATARVLDRGTDRKLWDRVAAIADRKYGWATGYLWRSRRLRFLAPDNPRPGVEVEPRARHEVGTITMRGVVEHEQ